MFNILRAKKMVRGLDFSAIANAAEVTSHPVEKSWEPIHHSLLKTDVFNNFPIHQNMSELSYILGTINGTIRYERLDKMPHLLVAGTTGSGKSVFINGILATLLLQHTPRTLRIGLVDPKMVEFAAYSDLPHLIGGKIAHGATDALPIIDYCVHEMERRLELMVAKRVKDLESYNLRCFTPAEELPRIVLVIDEFADIVLGAVTKEEKELVKRFERGLTRLAQKARATGIHLILATQKPITAVVTTVLRSNIPARVALKVSTAGDSRVIMDEPGAEALYGRGDLFYRSPTGGAVKRVQGVWIEDSDLDLIIRGG